MPKASTGATKTGPRFILKKDVPPTLEGKWYRSEYVPKPRKHKVAAPVTKLRKSITPGTVLILLAGRFRGKRVVFLKQLPSGLLLVSGPFKVNGVPLKRVDQAYVIATSTKVDVSGVSLPAAINDDLFKADKKTKVARGKADFLELRKTPVSTPAERKKLQEDVDSKIKLDAVQTEYLKAKFALSKGQKPHEMKF